MIELKVTGKCEGCPAMDLDFAGLYIEGQTAPYEATIICRNRMLCCHLQSHLENRIRGQIAEERQNGEVLGNG